ncbi:uncharacterized protein LOC129398687 [Pan paniscus]|uniref:uncharacterized protein LOC129398687 n=1 Tax=Pan paniscus TaxID=9597 RepID=UPI003004BD80
MLPISSHCACVKKARRRDPLQWTLLVQETEKGRKRRRKGRGKGKRKEENELKLRKWKSEKRFQIPDLTGGFLGLLKKKKKEKEKEKKKRSVINKKKTYLGSMNTLNI